MQNETDNIIGLHRLTGVALQPLPNECEALLPDGSDLVAEEMNN